MNQGNVYLNNLLRDYWHRLKMQEKELRRMPPGHLYVREQNGRVQFMHETTVKCGVETKERVRRGITKNQYLVRQLARKKYLENSVKLLSEEIARLENFMRSSIPPDVPTVLSMLPKAYRHLPEEMFRPEKRAAIKWAKEEYEQNTYNLNERKHLTENGLRVRSKSELFIADKLERYELPFRYEAMIYFRQYSFSPDFMIMTRDGIMYWEHCGMMMNQKYRRNNEWKLQMYDKMGITPWNNLIVTYDTEDGGLDLRIIESEIVNKLLPVKN